MTESSDRAGARRPPAGRTGSGSTDRGTRRRRAIVAAAADLFARRGYPAVGMDDIGAAAGVTGPAIYRHFDSKAAVLAAVIDGIIDAVDQPGGGPDAAARSGGDGPANPSGGRPSMPSGGRPSMPSGGRPSIPGGDGAADAGTVLSAHVAQYAAAVAERRELMAVFVREVHHLPAEHAERLRHRQRNLVARWRDLLAAAHPDWPAERVRTAVHAVFGMLNSVGTFSSPLTDADLAGLLARLASAALEVPPPA